MNSDPQFTPDLTSELLFEGIMRAEDTLETEFMPRPRTLRRRPVRSMLRMKATDELLDVLQELPAAGESVHVVSTAKWDFWTWVPAILKRVGPCDHLYCSTWTLSRANAQDLLALMDAGRIRTASFLTGTYFKRRETAVYSLLLEGLRARGGRFRAFQNHAKVLLLDCPQAAKAGYRLVIEGSANLTSNPRVEQCVVTNDAELYAFHQAWMEEVLAAGGKAIDPKPGRGGFRHSRAGDDVNCVTNNHAERRRVQAWKLAPWANPEEVDRLAAAIVDLIRSVCPELPAHPRVTTPPQGQTWPGIYQAYALASAVAHQLGVPFHPIIHREDIPVESGVSYLVIDDAIVTGQTMRNRLAQIRAAGSIAMGFAYCG